MGFAVEYLTITFAITAGFGTILPRVFSLPLAILTTFFINRYLSFGDFTRLNIKEIGVYFTGMLGSAGLSFCVYSGLVLYVLNPGVALVISTVLNASVNFLFSRSLFLKKP